VFSRPLSRTVQVKIYKSIMLSDVCICVKLDVSH
jgi:hypothetical protein